MNRQLLCLGIACLALSLSAGAAQPPAAALAFTHVAVINPDAGTVSSDMTVVVTGDRVTSLAPGNEARVPDAAQVIDATGKFMIPGLWDMHVHWYHKEYLPLFLANGVTGIRMMWGMPLHHAWQKELEQGSLLAPRMVLASGIVDGPQPIWPTSIVAANEAEARDAVRKSRQDGADFIKIYTLLRRDAFFAIADEAKKQRLPFAGHVPLSVSATEASNAGQQSIEHLTGILQSASANEDSLRKEQIEAFAKRTSEQRLPSTSSTRGTTRAMLDTFSAQKADAMFAQFKRNRTWQVPTITVLRSIAHLADADFRSDPRVKYLPPEVTGSWDPTKDFRFKERTPEDFDLAKRVYRKQLDVVRMMRGAGVEFLAGTDVINPYCFPGFSLHDELSLLVGSGLTPAEALRAATSNPARFLGKEKTHGAIAAGKIADLVVLDANPLENIAHTQKIHAVVVNGRLLDRAALDAQLAEAQARASRK